MKASLGWFFYSSYVVPPQITEEVAMSKGDGITYKGTTVMPTEETTQRCKAECLISGMSACKNFCKD